MIIGARIKERLEANGASQAELARAIGVSPQAISKLVLGETSESPKLYQIARFLKTTPEYLTGEIDDPAPPSGLQDRQLGFHGAPPDRSDSVELFEFDLAYGLGASYIHDVPVTGTKRTFSREWLRNFTSSPVDQLYFAQGIGDSMTPTILDADIVLIDTAQRSPRTWDKLWALELGGMGMIKRLRPTKDGQGIRLISDSGLPEEVAFDGELQIIGRVVAIVRKV